MTAAAVAEVVDLPLIEFVRPIPGFPGARQFALVRVEQSDLAALTSIEEGGPSFVVLPPAGFFPEYEVDIDDELVDELGIASAEDVIALLVVHAGETLATTTANLLAPIIVNTATLKAAQVIRSDDTLSVRVPLFAS